MSRELEDRLERVAHTLPTPTADSRDRARHAALATFGRPRRRRRPALLLIPAVLIVVAAATAAILAAPWGDSPLATERALAALGDQPVVHAIIEQPGPGGGVIDLESGEERPTEGQRTEYWYDDERDYLRARVSVGGRLQPGGEYLHTPEGFFTDVGVWRGPPPSVDPALEKFASGYREALESGDARVVGEEIVDGRNALILRFPLPSDPSGVEPSQEVAVDRDTHRPLRFRLYSPFFLRKVPWSEAARIVLIETIPPDPGDFQRPEAGEPRPEKQTSALAGTVTPAQAATALGQPVFWPGRAVEGVQLAKIQLMRLTTEWTDGHTSHGQSLAFQYGADRRTAHLEGRPSLIMTQTTSAKENLRFGPLDPEPKAGELHLIGFSNPSRSDVAMWYGAMKRDGVYISFESRRREFIVAAARSMKPLG
jgi:hypothetical protein